MNNELIPPIAQPLVDWIRETVTTAGFSNVVIGLSGGIDSAVSATLAAKALGVENVYVVLLPYRTMHTKAIEDAMSVVEFLGISKDHVFTINIQDAVDATLTHMQDVDAIRRGNVMARIRMVYLFDLAKKLGALVCGTENRTEHYLGYFTRFGDEASDLEPIRSLYKTQVWDMARALEIPQQIIDKAPTAGLWEGQTDENELGFSYADADTVLRYYFDEHLSADQIVAKGIPQETVAKVLERVAKNDFKHKLPYIFK